MAFPLLKFRRRALMVLGLALLGALIVWGALNLIPFEAKGAWRCEDPLAQGKSAILFSLAADGSARAKILGDEKSKIPEGRTTYHLLAGSWRSASIPAPSSSGADGAERIRFEEAQEKKALSLEAIFREASAPQIDDFLAQNKKPPIGAVRKESRFSGIAWRGEKGMIWRVEQLNLLGTPSGKVPLEMRCYSIPQDVFDKS